MNRVSATVGLGFGVVILSLVMVLIWKMSGQMTEVGVHRAIMFGMVSVCIIGATFCPLGKRLNLSPKHVFAFVFGIVFPLGGIVGASLVLEDEVVFRSRSGGSVEWASGPVVVWSPAIVREKSSRVRFKMQLSRSGGGWDEVYFSCAYTLVPEQVQRRIEKGESVPTPSQIEAEVRAALRQLSSEEATRGKLDSIFAEIVAKYGFKAL